MTTAPAETIAIGAVRIANNLPFALISGPCQAEGVQHSLDIAGTLAELCAARGISLIFKASYDKANRTAAGSFRGPGPDEGLRILQDVRATFGAPTLTDIHDVAQVEAASQAVDALQIPAFLCRQTDLLVEAGRSGLPVNVKKGQFLAPWDMQRVVEKVASTGNDRILLTERGTSFGYNNLVVDFKGLVQMRDFGYPVVLDVTHSLQLPAGEGERTGGQPEFALPMAMAGVAAGVDALFLEVHDDPPAALSDATTQLPLAELDNALGRVTRLRALMAELS